MPISGPNTVALAIRGPITRRELPGLGDRVRALVGGNAGTVVVCDVGDVEVDAVTVDALARLELAARRHGCRIWLRHASADLLALVDFMGLGDVLRA